MHRPELRTLVISATAALLLLSPSVRQLTGQDAGLRHHDGLGSLTFPATGDPEARGAFERGVLLMHSFEYEEAAAAFREAQRIDPAFAMAYWGEAMSYNHPVWDEQDRDAARAVLTRYAATPEARARRAPTERERRYLEAVDVLYGDGDKAARDTLYSRAMEDLVDAYPDDYEARAFYALSILGLSQGARDVPGYMRAGAIALDLFEQNPDHPGAAHYVIHSFDDPTHAPLGLEAARAYAGVAPDAAHAQHMTTHIFLALGMWDGVVEANERADHVVDRGRAGRDLPPTDCGHYNEWLAYGYQQQGRTADSEALVAGCLEEAAAQPGRAVSAAGMRAMHVASTESFDGPVAAGHVDPGSLAGTGRSTVRLVQAWADGYAAARQGNTEAARAHLETFERELATDPSINPYWSGYPPIWHGTLRSVVAAAEGDLEAAIAAAHEAAEHEATLPVDFGPPIAFKPPRELEAELLLQAGRAAESLSAFRMALTRTPRRARSLTGLARAADAAGEPGLAAGARAELAEVRDHTRP
jgi:tetratricopeptide (TPR) repeat protein